MKQPIDAYLPQNIKLLGKLSSISTLIGRILMVICPQLGAGLEESKQDMIPNEHIADETGAMPSSRKQLPEIVEAAPCSEAHGAKRAWCIYKNYRMLTAMWSAQSHAARVAKQNGTHQTPGLDLALIMICVGVLIVAALSFAGIL